MKIRILCTALSAIISAGAIAAEQPDNEGIYSAVQASKGKKVYQSQCAMCHGQKLEGVNAPALIGTDLIGKFASVADLYSLISTTMPPQAAGQLEEKKYLGIIAYILEVNGAAAGHNALRNDHDTNQAFSLAKVIGKAKHQPHNNETATISNPAPQAYTWGKTLPAVANANSSTNTKPARRSTTQKTVGKYTPVTDADLLAPPQGEWLTWRRTLDNQGYSPLGQINHDTVAQLQLAWAWPMADAGIQETAPLMHDGVLFLQTNDAIVQALDARTGELIWEFRPALAQPPEDWFYQRYQSRRQKNSIALYKGAVVLTTPDARILILDAKTGKVLREKQVLDPKLGYSYTVGPIVFAGKIISAISGCSVAQTAGGCYILAHDFDTLEEIWRVNTLDDPNNPAQGRSWGDVPTTARWGGTPWTTGSFDPETNTTYWGTGGPGPYAELVRGSGTGDVLYTNSTLAIDATTGKLKWYYQHLPRDNWDLDSPFERILVDIKQDKDIKRLLISVAGKNGIFFALDRDTGKYLWSQETVYQNSVSKIDANGRVHVNEALIPNVLGEEKLICSSISGGKLWQAASYSPLTHKLFVPLTEACNQISAMQSTFTEGNMVGSMRFGPRKLPEGIDQAGLVEAIQIGAKKSPQGTGWKFRQRPSMTSSMLATAGGLVFGGDAGRYIKAWDQETGELIWQQRLNAPLGGHPMSYELDGEQYIVFPTGYSAAAATIAATFPEVPLPSGAGNSIFVFKLSQRPSEHK